MINVQVRTESGEIVLEGNCKLDWMKTFQHVDEDSFPFLGSMLPYADAMFNSRQAERIRREIAGESIREIFGGNFVVEMEGLCLQVESGSHLNL